ncbi:hypothetical protein C8R43DRAFT_1120332 [Mycena crocata]|nr:hypothetical protein C8R43DRAFT_1120332 [Mycena crocata]
MYLYMHAYYSPTCPIFAPYLRLFPLRLSSSRVLIRARVLEAGWREHSHANFFVPTRTLSHIPSRPDRPDVNLFVASREILHANFPPDPLAHSFTPIYSCSAPSRALTQFFSGGLPQHPRAHSFTPTHSCTRRFFIYFTLPWRQFLRAITRISSRDLPQHPCANLFVQRSLTCHHVNSFTRPPHHPRAHSFTPTHSCTRRFFIYFTLPWRQFLRAITRISSRDLPQHPRAHSFTRIYSCTRHYIILFSPPPWREFLRAITRISSRDLPQHPCANLFVPRSLTCPGAYFFTRPPPAPSREFIRAALAHVPSREFLHATSPSTLARIPSRGFIRALAIILFYFRRRPGVNFFVPSRKFLHTTSPSTLARIYSCHAPSRALARISSRDLPQHPCANLFVQRSLTCHHANFFTRPPQHPRAHSFTRIYSCTRHYIILFSPPPWREFIRAITRISSRDLPQHPHANLFVQPSGENFFTRPPPAPLRAFLHTNLFVHSPLFYFIFAAALATRTRIYSCSPLARISSRDLPQHPCAHSFTRIYSCTRHYFILFSPPPWREFLRAITRISSRDLPQHPHANLFVQPSGENFFTRPPPSTLARIPSREFIRALAIILFYFRRRPGVNSFVPPRGSFHATSPSTLARIPSRQPIRALPPLFHLVNHSALFTTDYSFQGPPLLFPCSFLRLELQALAVLAKNRSYKYALRLQYYLRTR